MGAEIPKSANWFGILLDLIIYKIVVLKTEFRSPDSSGNPFVPVFGTKDCSKLLRQIGFQPRVREIAPKTNLLRS
jgi:hypothetical protein